MNTTNTTNTTRRCAVRRAGVAVAAAMAAGLLLAACGSDDSSAGQASHDMSGMPATSASAATSGPSAANQGPHNAQDVAFAQAMIPHHQQAVAMADLAASRAKSQQVKTLAAQIKQAQGPEITTMSGWLTAWGESVPQADPTSTAGTPASISGMTGMDGMSGTDSSASPMPGMMGDADMTKLAGLSGAAFDTAFLEMMVSHHQGAIDMAKTEQAKGGYAPAKQLAASIVTSQSAQITTMNQLLGG